MNPLGSNMTLLFFDSNSSKKHYNVVKPVINRKRRTKRIFWWAHHIHRTDTSNYFCMWRVKIHDPVLHLKISLFWLIFNPPNHIFSRGWDRLFLKACTWLTNPRRRRLRLRWSLSDKEGLWLGQLGTNRGPGEASPCTTPGGDPCATWLHTNFSRGEPRH